LAQDLDIKPFPTYKEVRDENLKWPKLRSAKYWEYRKNWVEYPKKMFVSIQMKEGSGYLPENDAELPMDLYKKIIDEGAENGLCSVKLQYLGEPTADSYLTERIKYAKDKGILDVMFNTNATLLTEELSHKILEAGIDDIFFSVDSIIPSKFNKIRVGADYYQVVENIKNFIKIKNEGGYDHVQTRTSMVLLPGTKDSEVEEYVNFWKPLVGIVGFDEWVDHSSGHGEYEEYNPNFVCAMPFQRMFILYDGICTPCCVDVKRGYVIGDANKTPIKEIWNGERFTKLRGAHMNGNYRDIQICKECYVPFTKVKGDGLS